MTWAVLWSILADLARDLLGWVAVGVCVWALVKGRSAWNDWREDVKAVDRSADALRAFEARRSYPGHAAQLTALALGYTSDARRYPLASADLREAIKRVTPDCASEGYAVFASDQ